MVSLQSQSDSLQEPTIDISIIIVNWNTLELLRECLSSLYHSTLECSMEVIVVDNGSSDGSVEMVRQSFPDVQLIENKTNLGFSAANNLGMQAAKSDYILLLNSDTIIINDVVNNSLRYMRENKAVGAMGCRVLNSDGTLQLTSGGYPTFTRLFYQLTGLDRLPWPEFLDNYKLRHWRRDCERDVDVISGCYLLVRRSVVDAVGRLDEKFFFFGEETDWCYRMRKFGWRLVVAPVGEIVHHGGGSVKRLSFHRDLMLASAILKLHIKHQGTLSAVAVYATLIAFHISRSLFWTGRWVLLGEADSKLRALHFWNLVKKTNRIWPSECTYNGTKIQG